MTQLWKGEEIFRSDCDLQIAPSDIDFFKDDATVCDLIMQSRCHKFIATLSILKKKFSHFAILSKTLQHGELRIAALLSAVSYCLTRLDEILKRKVTG